MGVYPVVAVAVPMAITVRVVEDRKNVIVIVQPDVWCDDLSIVIGVWQPEDKRAGPDLGEPEGEIVGIAMDLLPSSFTSPRRKGTCAEAKGRLRTQGITERIRARNRDMRGPSFAVAEQTGARHSA